MIPIDPLTFVVIVGATVLFVTALQAMARAGVESWPRLRRRGVKDERSAGRGTPRPFWRWWVFCAGMWLDVRTSWAWPRRLWAWACSPRSWWVEDGETVDASGTEPF